MISLLKLIVTPRNSSNMSRKNQFGAGLAPIGPTKI